MKEYVVKSCEYMLHEDDWNEGQGNLMSIWDEDAESADTLLEALGNIHYLDCDYNQNQKLLCKDGDGVFCNDPTEEADYSRFDADLMVDIDGYENIIMPSEEKVEKFKKGECKLYNLHITAHVMKIEKLDESDITFQD